MTHEELVKKLATKFSYIRSVDERDKLEEWLDQRGYANQCKLIREAQWPRVAKRLVTDY